MTVAARCGRSVAVPSSCRLVSSDTRYASSLTVIIPLIGRNLLDDPTTITDKTLVAGVRRCGACTACCTHLPISSGQVGPGPKPAGVRCPHLGYAGCRIYMRRPRLCANFRCDWHRNQSWPQSWRPDRSGLLCLSEEIRKGLPAALVYEIRNAALETPSAAAILEQLKQNTVVIAVVDTRKRRHRIMGNLRIDTLQPRIPAPHFLGRQSVTSPSKSDEAA